MTEVMVKHTDANCRDFTLTVFRRRVRTQGTVEGIAAEALQLIAKITAFSELSRDLGMMLSKAFSFFKLT
jgi:hypothetical protein